MKIKATLILTTDKPGHYKSYGDLCKVLLGAGEVLPNASFQKIIGTSSLVLVDGDAKHLMLFPLVIIRALLGRSTVFLSVRTEDYVGLRVKSKIKKKLMGFLVKFRAVRFISIHYPDLCQFEGRFISKCVYDPQLWDLPYVDSTEELPPELGDLTRFLLVLGALNEKRCKGELIKIVSEMPNVHVVFAGKVTDMDVLELNSAPNVTLINRYVLDSEILALYRRAGAVYAYYDQAVRRPSGIFGRAVQCGRPVIVRKDGYLDQQYGSYSKVVAIPTLDELEGAFVECLAYGDEVSEFGFDHSDVFRNLLLVD